MAGARSEPAGDFLTVFELFAHHSRSAQSCSRFVGRILESQGRCNPMRKRHRHSHEISEPDVNRFPAAQNGDDEDDEEEEEEERRHDDQQEEEEEEPVWTASGVNRQTQASAAACQPSRLYRLVAALEIPSMPLDGKLSGAGCSRNCVS
jgi:hypothetical protein